MIKKMNFFGLSLPLVKDFIRLPIHSKTMNLCDLRIGRL